MASFFTTLKNMGTTVKLYTSKLGWGNWLMSAAVPVTYAARAIVDSFTIYVMSAFVRAVAEEDDEVEILPNVFLSRRELVWFYFSLQVGSTLGLSTLNRLFTEKVQIASTRALIKELTEKTIEPSYEQMEKFLERDDKIAENARRILGNGNSAYTDIMSGILPALFEISAASFFAYRKLGVWQGSTFVGFAVVSMVVDQVVASTTDKSSGAWVRELYARYAEYYGNRNINTAAIMTSNGRLLQSAKIFEASDNFHTRRDAVNNRLTLLDAIKSTMASGFVAVYLYVVSRDGFNPDDIDDLTFFLAYVFRFSKLVTSLDDKFVQVAEQMEDFLKIKGTKEKQGLLYENENNDEVHSEDSQSSVQSLTDTPPSGVPGLDVLRLSGSSFSYSDKQPVLTDVSLAVPSGKRHALVGRSGCGKSTLMELALGLRRASPDNSITILGKNITHIPAEDLYRHVAWLPQMPPLFSGSLKYNIMFTHYGVEYGQDSGNAEVNYRQLIDPLNEESNFEAVCRRAILYKLLQKYYTQLSVLYIDLFVVKRANTIFPTTICRLDTKFLEVTDWQEDIDAYLSNVLDGEHLLQVYSDIQKIQQQPNGERASTYIQPICILTPENTISFPHRWRAIIYSFSVEQKEEAAIQSQQIAGLSPQSQGAAHQTVVQIAPQQSVAMSRVTVSVVLLGCASEMTLSGRKRVEISQTDPQTKERWMFNCELEVRQKDELAGVKPANNSSFLTLLITLHHFMRERLSDKCDTLPGNCCVGAKRNRMRRKIQAAYPQLGNTKDAKALVSRHVTLTDVMTRLNLKRVSGGEKQRIGMARNFARSRASFYCLDEPYSALDAFTAAELDAAFQEYIQQESAGVSRRRGKQDESVATLTISHGLFSIRNSDKIYFMRDKRIAKEDQGTHTVLMQTSDAYQEAAELQGVTDTFAPVSEIRLG